jgi:HTH-type transcriptional regulator / antitoxin HipB
MRLRTPADFGAAIRDRRLRDRLTQAARARKVGVGRQWIVEVEKGKPGAPLALLLRTLGGLNIALQTDEAPRNAKPTSRKNKTVNLDFLLDNLRQKKPSTPSFPASRKSWP